MKVIVASSQERSCCAWIGGSIYASLVCKLTTSPISSRCDCERMSTGCGVIFAASTDSIAGFGRSIRAADMHVPRRVAGIELQGSFQQMWVGKEEFKERGKDIFKKRCP